jgi:cobalt-zinc-cadmium efflux system outer membrane protein
MRNGPQSLGLLGIGLLLAAGCTAAGRQPPPLPTPTGDLPVSPQEIQPVGYQQPAESPPAPPAQLPPPTAAAPFGGVAELSADAVVQAVLERNPTLAQMSAAWEAASARPAQVSSLDDPMLGVQAAPSAFGSNQVNGGYRVDIAQKYPWFGKRALRGENAAAEAAAAGEDVEDTRLQLAEAARDAFYEYYLADRALEVNRRNLTLLRGIRKETEDRYAANRGLQQEIFQTDVEIGRQQERLLALERAREVAVARLNTLMHLPPDAPLPPPPADAGPAVPPPDAVLLRRQALAARPDLKALADRVAAEEAALALARKEYLPDVELMAAYDTFWQERQLRPQVGMRLNLPVRLARRSAAVAEAEARVAQRRAELARRVDRVAFEVQQAAAQVRESARVVQLYRDQILKAARENVEAARSGFGANRVPFLNLIEAQRSAVGLEERAYEAQADYFRRLATLQRVVGVALASAPAGPVPCQVP